jgi:hypothetical protein
VIDARATLITVSRDQCLLSARDSFRDKLSAPAFAFAITGNSFVATAQACKAVFIMSVVADEITLPGKFASLGQLTADDVY